MDRAQRLRPGRHADRALRLDDRDGHLPAQPDPGQAARRADGAARDRARAGHAPARADLRFRLVGARGAPGLRSRPPSPRSPRRAPRARTRSSSRRSRTARSRPPRRRRTWSSAGAPSRTSAWPPAWPSRRAPTSCRSACRPRSATPSTSCFDDSLARLLMRVDVDCSQARGAGVDPEDPPLKWEAVQRRRPGRLERGDGPARHHRRLQLRQRRGRAADARLARARDRSPGTRGALAALPPRRHDPPGRAGRDVLPSAGDLLDHRRADRRARARPRTASESRRSRSARATAPPARASALRNAPVLALEGRRGPRGARARHRDLARAGTCGRASPRAAPAIPTTRSTWRAARSTFGPAIRSRRGRAGASTARCRPRARGCACAATATAAGAGATSRRGALTVLKSAIPTVSSVVNPERGRGRRRPGDARGRAPARRDGDPHPLPRGDRRGLRVPLRRGVAARRARDLHRAARHRRRGAPAPRAARSSPPTGCSPWPS